MKNNLQCRFCGTSCGGGYVDTRGVFIFCKLTFPKRRAKSA